MAFIDFWVPVVYIDNDAFPARTQVGGDRSYSRYLHGGFTLCVLTCRLRSGHWWWNGSAIRVACHYLPDSWCMSTCWFNSWGCLAGK